MSPLNRQPGRWWGTGSAAVAILTTVWLAWLVLWPAHCPMAAVLLTPDQRGQLLMEQGQFGEAAAWFQDPFRKATAFYRAGEFKDAASLWSGFNTAEGAFNHGNALAMQGRYEDAIRRYERALELRPDWEAAVANLAIARQSAARLKKEGGDMTGGQLGADEITFTKRKSPEAGEETTEGGEPLSDAELRATWLRRVQTRPADFLRTKFAYQAAERAGE